MTKIIHEDDKGFIFKDVGDKKNYGVFHKKEAGDKQLGWIDKATVNHMVDKKEAK